MHEHMIYRLHMLLVIALPLSAFFFWPSRFEAGHKITSVMILKFEKI